MDDGRWRVISQILYLEYSTEIHFHGPGTPTSLILSLKHPAFSVSKSNEMYSDRHQAPTATRDVLVNCTSNPIEAELIRHAPNRLCSAIWLNSSLVYARLSNTWRKTSLVIQPSSQLRPLCRTYLSISSIDASFRRSAIMASPPGRSIRYISSKALIGSEKFLKAAEQ